MTHSLEGRATRFGSDRLINSERLTSRSLRRSATGCQQVRDITSRDGELAEPGRLITLPAAHECPRRESRLGPERSDFASLPRSLKVAAEVWVARWLRGRLRSDGRSVPNRHPQLRLGIEVLSYRTVFPHPHPVARAHW